MLLSMLLCVFSEENAPQSCFGDACKEWVFVKQEKKTRYSLNEWDQIEQKEKWCQEQELRSNGVAIVNCPTYKELCKDPEIKKQFTHQDEAHNYQNQSWGDWLKGYVLKNAYEQLTTWCSWAVSWYTPQISAPCDDYEDEQPFDREAYRHSMSAYRYESHGDRLGMYL